MYTNTKQTADAHVLYNVYKYYCDVDCFTISISLHCYRTAATS